MRRKYYYSLVFFIFSIHFNLAQAQIKSKLIYEIKAQQNWKTDYETESPDQGKNHLILKADMTIDILTSFSDEKLLVELNKQGLEKTLAQILNAKNTIQNLVSDDPVTINNSKVENLENGKKMILETNFSYGIKKYHTVEYYFLFENTVLHTVLRWNQNSNPDQVELAKSDFKSISVKMK